LDGLAGGPFYQIVDDAYDDGAARGSVEFESDVTKVGAIDYRQIRKAARLIEADESLTFILLQVDVEQILSGFDIAGAYVNCFQDAAIDGEQMGGEGELWLVETGDHENFGDVAMIERRIDGEIVSDFAKTGFEAGFAPSTAHAGLGVADDSSGSIGYAAGDQGLNGEIRGGGITAGVGDQSGGANTLAAELGEAIDRLGEQMRRRVLLFVPARIRGGVAKAEGAAEIDDLCPGVEHGGREFHGDFGRRGKEDYVQTFGADGFGSAGSAARLWMIDGRGSGALILTVFKKDGLSVGMGGEEADEFLTTVAAEAEDACLIFIHLSE
jgi:hypothetical protein